MKLFVDTSNRRHNQRYLTLSLPRPTTHRCGPYSVIVCDAKKTLILETYKQRLVLENLEKWKTLECLTNTIPNWRGFGLRAFPRSRRVTPNLGGRSNMLARRLGKPLPSPRQTQNICQIWIGAINLTSQTVR